MRRLPPALRYRNPLGALAAAIVTVVLLVCVSSVIQAQPTTGAREKPMILFLTSEDKDNYQAHETVPRFAATLEASGKYRCVVIRGEGPLTAFQFPGVVGALQRADLLVCFFRRVALPGEQLAAIKGYLASGRPLIGIRTANHGFEPRGEVAAGHETWPEFVSDYLGCKNRGYGPVSPGTDVTVTGDARHPILRGVPSSWHSAGNVYHVAPLLDPAAIVLLTGTVPGKVEPIAWIRQAGKTRVFYTSLGHPSDFESGPLQTLLTNAMAWAMGK